MHHSPLGVSACLIVRDEVGSLRGCLESVAAFVDEIVVADTGSADGTPELARDFGAMVVDVPWRDDFAAARNAAAASCTMPWVLSIDADERAEGVGAWLTEMLAAVDEDVLALNLQITQAEPYEAHVHHATKLFRRERCSWSGRVHEFVIDSAGRQVQAPNLPDGVLRLTHHGYGHLDTALAKARRNARIAELQLAELLACDAPDIALARAALDLGRSQLACGRRAEGRSNLLFAQDRCAQHSEAWFWAQEFLRGSETSS